MPVTVDPSVITNATGQAVQIVVGSLSDAIGSIITQGGWLLVFVLASLAFMFIGWSFRLFHLRGR